MPKTMMQYLPKYYNKSKVIADVVAQMQAQADKNKLDQDSTDRNILATTANADGLMRFEREYGIQSDERTRLESRRSGVVARERGNGVTNGSLIRDAAAAYSNGEVEVTEKPDEYMVCIKFVSTKGVPKDIDALTATLYELIAAHADFEYIFTYNTWDDVARLTWATAATCTWDGLRERGGI